MIFPRNLALGEYSVKKLLCLFAFVVALIIASALAAKANDVYIAQSQAGSNNGASCANAYAVTYFNTSGNWTSGTPTGTQIGPGTTVHLCSTITTELTFQGSGSSGKVITLLAETGAVLSSPGSTLININGKSYLLLDGGTTCGWINHAQTACHGTMQNTLNGSPGAACIGGSCSLQNTFPQIDMYTIGGASNIEIRNWLMQDAYVHTASDANTPGDNTWNGIVMSSVGGTISIHNNIMHDCSWCMRLDSYSSGTVLNAYNNDIYNNDHDFAIGGTTSTTPITIYIHDYHGGAKANWDNAGHHDGIHLTPYIIASSVTGIYIYNNQWDGNWGTDTTAYLFMENTLPNMYVFNNVMLLDNDSNITNGQFGQIEVSGGLFANNSFYADASYGGTCAGSGCTGIYLAISNSSTRLVNSLFSGLGVSQSNSSGALASNSDYNLYAHSSGSYYWIWAAGGDETTLSAWKSACSCDAHALDYTSSTLNVNANAVPQSGFQGANSATNLYSVCSGQPNPGLGALCYDASGNARPSSGAWDAGAYQSGSGAGNGPQPPTGLAAIVQ